jgi:hypothetical protein
MKEFLYHSLLIMRRTKQYWRGTACALATIVSTAGTAQAQVDTYQFVAAQGTFTPLPATAIQLYAVQLDDAISGAVPLGFSFAFDGVSYTNAYVSSNGFLSFNSAAGAASSNSLAMPWVSEQPLLAPLWDDLSGSDPSSAAHYQTAGTAPNRVFTMEWRNWKWDYNAATPAVSFQVKLYETTNQVEFIYRPEAGSTNFPSASIGIVGTGTPADFLSLNTTTATPSASYLFETATLSTVPAAGQRYTFTPQLPSSCPTPRNLTQTAATTTTARVSWTVASGGGTFSINYGLPGFIPGTGGQTVTSTTSAVTLTGLTPGTEYQFYVTQLCGTTPSNRSPIGTFRSDCVAPLYAPLPFSETFDSNWLSRCNTRDVPSNSWRNLPATGDLSWRRDDDGAAANWNTVGSGTYAPRGASGSSHSARFHSSSNTAGQQGTLDLYVDLSAAGSKRLSFGAINMDGPDSLAVQVSTDGGATFGPVLLQLTSSANGFQNQQLTLPSTSATSVIRFRATADYGFSDIGLDDVRVEALNSCLTPLNLAVAGTSTTSANITWSGTAGGTYTVFYGPIGFTPGGTGSQQMTGITGPSATITGLTPSTGYQFYVRQNCGGTTSLTAGPGAFRTMCLTPLYATAPFTETFENTWLNRCDTREVPSNSWRNSPATGDDSWRRDDDGAAANWTDLSFGTYTPAGTNGSAHSARFHSSSLATAAQIGTLDLFMSLTGASYHELAFDYTIGSNADSLLVQLSTDGGLTFGQPLAQLTVSTGAWQTQVLQLTTTSATTVIRFRATDYFGSTDIGLDNVSITTCARVGSVAVSNITAATATVTFTPVASGTAYTVVATPATGTPVTVAATGSPVSLSGLQGQTAYTVSVVATCGPGRNSVPVTATFTTLVPPTLNDEPCNAITLIPGNAAVAATNFGATSTVPNGYSNPSCSPATLPRDVWFKFVAPAAATPLAVQVTGNPAGLIRLFSAANCSAPFTQLACQSSTGPNTAATPLALPSLTAGATYYVSVSGYGSADITGLFTIGLTTVLSTGPGYLLQGEVSLYPNPSHDGLLNLRLRVVSNVNNVTAVLLNSLGQQVFTQSIGVRGGLAEQALPVQNLAKGFYTLRLLVGENTITRKIVLD